MIITPYNLAQRFDGLREIRGPKDNPMILAMLKLCTDWEDGLEKVKFAAWPQHDEVPWCSAFVNFIAWACRLPRSRSLMAKSWLKVGIPITIEEAIPDRDVVILHRGNNPIYGHVGFFGGATENEVYIFGGNQNDEANLSPYSKRRLAGVRRL